MTTSFEIRALVKQGRRQEAAAAAARLLGEETGLSIADVHINDDRYSLNSVNGIVTCRDGQKLFFKFHTEEGEAETVGEYYKAHVLADCGLPVDLPVKASTTPGRQFLLYAFRNDAKLADVCLKLETRQPTEFSAEEVIAAQSDLEDATLQAALRSIAPPTPESQAEAIHQLFHHRLVDVGGAGRLGGRYAQFYKGRRLTVAGKELAWEELADLKWSINGLHYEHTLRELFDRSLHLLDPRALAGLPVLVSHGDAHNANVWARRDETGRLRLTLFDPAFAGKTIPALLGEIKATFHNIFAHPLWLYTPELAERAYSVSVERLATDRIAIAHNWQLGDLRQEFLRLKLERYWRPLLSRLQAMMPLPQNWEATMRSALFCCPTLVMSQMPSPERPLSVSLLGLSVAVMCGSNPERSSDDLTRFFAGLREAGRS